jgi:hypothetical protein
MEADDAAKVGQLSPGRPAMEADEIAVANDPPSQEMHDDYH